MELSKLTAISPIDGRYRGKTESLGEYFSEYALVRYRVRVEIEYFITLCELPLPQLSTFNHELFECLRDIYRQFTPADAQRVKDIEKVTNHDVKAVEYFIKERIDAIAEAKSVNLEPYKEFIHFGLTSQDINNTSVPLSIKEALEQVKENTIKPSVFMQKSNTPKPFADLSKALNRARKLVEHLEKIPKCDPSRVPQDSILLEFIGNH